MASTSSSMVIISSTHDDISNWEFIDSFDYHDDHDVVAFSDDDSFTFASSSSSSDHDLDDDVVDDVHQDVADDVHQDVVDDVHEAGEEEEEGEKDGPTDDDVDVGTHDMEELMAHVTDVVLRDDNDHDYGYGGEYDMYDGYGGYGHVCEENKDEEEDESDGDDDDDGMDDMLVPWEVKNVFVRQRIRKSGKKGVLTKRANSKKSPLVFTRAGCVRGKFALGLKVY